jgi:hypothetical protein
MESSNVSMHNLQTRGEVDDSTGSSEVRDCQPML